MSEDNFQQRIEAKQESLRAVIAVLEQIREEFIPVVGKFAADWWLQTAKREVEQAHDVTARLKDDQLRQMKAEINGLVTDAEKHVREFFSDGDVWWHLQKSLDLKPGESSPRYDCYGNNGPEKITKPLRLVLGKLATVMEKYGYFTPLGDRGFGRWREYDRSGNYQPHDARASYPFSLDWPKPFAPIIERYSSHKGAAEKILQEIAAIEEERKKTIAKKRWDSA